MCRQRVKTRFIFGHIEDKVIITRIYLIQTMFLAAALNNLRVYEFC